MTPDRQRGIARGIGLTSALIMLACTVLLIGDHVTALQHAAADKSRVDALRERVATDPDVATALHEELERQRDITLSRETRNKGIAWILLLTGGICVACGKWYMVHRPQPLPTLDDLVDARFAPVTAEKATPTLEAPAADYASGETDFSKFVDDLVTRFGDSREAAIPILQAIQAHYRYLPDDVLQHLCQVTQITPAQIAGNASFYAQFRRSPVGRHLVRVCHGTACHVAGVQHVTEELRRHLEIPPAQDTDARRLFTVEAVACLGCCSLAPVMMIDESTAGRLTPASARKTLDALVPPT